MGILSDQNRIRIIGFSIDQLRTIVHKIENHAYDQTDVDRVIRSLKQIGE